MDYTNKLKVMQPASKNTNNIVIYLFSLTTILYQVN